VELGHRRDFKETSINIGRSISMNQSADDSSNLGDGTNSASLKRETSMLRNEALANQCLKELGHYQRGEPCDERYGLELFRRATLECDPEAWEWVQHCFRDLARGWLRRHPSREKAMNLESEENYDEYMVI
jgi:hypothetical protein